MNNCANVDQKKELNDCRRIRTEEYRMFESKLTDFMSRLDNKLFFKRKTNKRNFLIGFKFDEARLLKEYILKGLGQCFDFGSTKPAVKEAMPSFNAPSKEETNEDDLW